MTEEQFQLLLELIRAAIADATGDLHDAIYFNKVCQEFRAIFVKS